MRINYKNTALKFFDSGDGCEDDFIIDENANKENIDAMMKSFVNRKNYFIGNIRYLSEPFYEAYLKARDKLVEILKDETDEISGSGVFILNSLNRSPITVFYHITSEVFEFFLFDKFRDHQRFTLGITWDANNKIINYIDPNIQNAKNDRIFAETRIDIFCLLCFLKYCKVETKTSEPNSKLHAFNCKYLNETNYRIEILDSTWFTTLVNSSGFGVRGHFRLQPYKEGKEIIWINPYQKNGYIRKAKVLRHE